MSDPDLYPWMALRRVDSGGMARSAGAYFDCGRPTPGHLAEVFDQLIWAGFVAVAEGDALWELRRMSLTDTGKARYAVLSEQLDPEHAVPSLKFGTTTQTPVSRRSEPPGSRRPIGPHLSTPAMRWARDPHDGRLHACEPADVALAASRGYTEALCGWHLPADVGLEDGPSGALCLPCVTGVTAETDDPGRMGAAL